jgi:hypothetical protein
MKTLEKVVEILPSFGSGGLAKYFPTCLSGVMSCPIYCGHRSREIPVGKLKWWKKARVSKFIEGRGAELFVSRGRLVHSQAGGGQAPLIRQDERCLRCDRPNLAHFNDINWVNILQKLSTISGRADKLKVIKS